MDRQKYLRLLITEAIHQTLLEQEQTMPPAPPAGAGGAPAAAAPMGGPDPAAGGGSSLPPPPADAGMGSPDAGSPETQEEIASQPGGITVDSIVERLNIIRAGKSLHEPAVYGKMRALINGLSLEQKTILNFVLQEIEKVVVKVPFQGVEGEVPPPAAGEPAPAPAPPAPAPTEPPAPGGTPPVPGF